MNFILNKQEFNGGEAKRIKYKGVEYFYDGIIYMLGLKAGEESVRRLACYYDETGEIPFLDLYGSYHIAMRFPDGRVLLFTDNSYQNVYYVGKDCISSSFLEAIRYEKKINFDLEAVCEYFVIGNVYFQKTFIESIRLSSPHLYYIIENGLIVANNKNLGEIDIKSKIAEHASFLRKMNESLFDMCIAQSLTGGYDSRMLYAALHSHPRLVAFLTGDVEQSSEIKSAKKAALAGNHDLQLFAREKPNVSDTLLWELFIAADGSAEFVENGFIRMHFALKELKKRGCDCYISGDGGVLHKDWWWLQDFPFYKRKHINFSRFYDQRIVFIKKEIPLGDKFNGLYRDLKDRFIQEIIKFKKELNTQTYDNLYFNINGSKTSVFYNGRSKIIHSYAPLWEYELVRLSYSAKRSKRFFNRIIREVTTDLSPQIARVPTNYGTTASADKTYISRDIIFQSVDYVRKLIRIFGRKLLKKNLFNEIVLSWTIEKEIRGLPLTKQAIDWCIKQNYITAGTQILDISFELIGRAVHLYLLNHFICHLKKTDYYKQI